MISFPSGVGILFKFQLVSMSAPPPWTSVAPFFKDWAPFFPRAFDQPFKFSMFFAPHWLPQCLTTGVLPPPFDTLTVNPPSVDRVAFPFFESSLPARGLKNLNLYPPPRASWRPNIQGRSACERPHFGPKSGVLNVDFRNWDSPVSFRRGPST